MSQISDSHSSSEINDSDRSEMCIIEVPVSDKDYTTDGSTIINAPAIPVSHCIASISFVMIGLMLFVCGISKAMERTESGMPMLLMACLALIPGTIYVYELY